MVVDIWQRTIQIVREETAATTFRIRSMVFLYPLFHRQDSTYHDLCCTICGALAEMKNSSMDLPWNIDLTCSAMEIISLLSTVVRAFAHGAMGHQIDYSWGGPIELFLVPASAHDLCNKGRVMCSPVCGMVHIKEPLLLIEKSSPCGRCKFPLTIWVVLYHMSDAI